MKNSERIMGHIEAEEIRKAVSSCEKCGKNFEEFITSTDPEAEIKFCEACAEKIKIINEKWKNVKLDRCGWLAEIRTEVSVKKRKQNDMHQNKRIIMWLHEEFGEGNENVKIIIDALEKQIPKKPTNVRIVEGTVMQSISNSFNQEVPCEIKMYRFICPYCNRHISGRYAIKYCDCGQKLDWSDEA